jgi:cytochrome c5
VSNQDQKFLDTFTLVIGGLVAVALVIFIFSLFTGGRTQREARQDDPDYQQALMERIAPIGQVRLPGDSAQTGESASPVTAPSQVATMMSGPQVYNAACVACHGAGIGGAPKLGDAAGWAPRIAQGREVLHRHAIEGYQGQLGYMPPKGGRVDLSDEEIQGAVDFMIGESS